MNDKQLGVLYAIVLFCWVGSFALLHSILSKPMSAEDYVNKFCQELYGPQTASHWSGDKMMCITQRGEILPAKRPDL